MWERQVGERISRLRKERNLTRAELGELTGLSERRVGKIERGDYKITVDDIARICDKTGVSADHVIFGTIDTMAAIAALNGLTHEQAEVVLDIAMNVIKFLNTETGNNVLIQEVSRRHHMAFSETSKHDNTKNTSV